LGEGRAADVCGDEKIAAINRGGLGWIQSKNERTVWRDVCGWMKEAGTDGGKGSGQGQAQTTDG